MISSFKFINHIVLCHLAHPHESIQSPRSPIAHPHKSKVCAQCSWSQVSAFQHYCNLPLTSSPSQSLYPLPQPYPPFGSNPSSLPLLPYALVSLFPFILARAFRTSLVAPSSQPHIPLPLPVYRLQWFSHSLCLPPRPFRPSSVLQTSVGLVLLAPTTCYIPPSLI